MGKKKIKPRPVSIPLEEFTNVGGRNTNLPSGPTGQIHFQRYGYSRNDDMNKSRNSNFQSIPKQATELIWGRKESNTLLKKELSIPENNTQNTPDSNKLEKDIQQWKPKSNKKSSTSNKSDIYGGAIPIDNSKSKTIKDSKEIEVNITKIGEKKASKQHMDIFCQGEKRENLSKKNIDIDIPNLKNKAKNEGNSNSKVEQKKIPENITADEGWTKVNSYENKTRNNSIKDETKLSDCKEKDKKDYFVPSYKLSKNLSSHKSNFGSNTRENIPRIRNFGDSKQNTKQTNKIKSRYDMAISNINKNRIESDSKKDNIMNKPKNTLSRINIINSSDNIFGSGNPRSDPNDKNIKKNIKKIGNIKLRYANLSNTKNIENKFIVKNKKKKNEVNTLLRGLDSRSAIDDKRWEGIYKYILSPTNEENKEIIKNKKKDYNKFMWITINSIHLNKLKLKKILELARDLLNDKCFKELFFNLVEIYLEAYEERELIQKIKEEKIIIYDYFNFFGNQEKFNEWLGVSGIKFLELKDNNILENIKNNINISMNDENIIKLIKDNIKNNEDYTTEIIEIILDVIINEQYLKTKKEEQCLLIKLLRNNHKIIKYLCDISINNQVKILDYITLLRYKKNIKPNELIEIFKYFNNEKFIMCEGIEKWREQKVDKDYELSKKEALFSLSGFFMEIKDKLQNDQNSDNISEESSSEFDESELIRNKNYD